MSAEELYDRVKKEHPGSGYATFYRTLKTIVIFKPVKTVLKPVFPGKTGLSNNAGEHHDHKLELYGVCAKCRKRRGGPQGDGSHKITRKTTV